MSQQADGVSLRCVVLLNDTLFILRKKIMNLQVLFWIIVGIVAIIALLIHTYNEEFGIDFEDIFECLIEDFGWVTVLVVVGIGGIVYGFAFWVWWIMLLIVGGVVVITIIAFAIFYHYNNKEILYEETTEKTKYKCDNCGAFIVRKTDAYGNVTHYCEYCGISYDENDDYDEDEEDEYDDEEEITLSDFEEEYFNACEKFFYKPYNEHSESRIDNKYKELCARLKHGTIYEDSYNTAIDKIDLDTAYNFFKKQEDEIEDYFLNYDEDEIKSRYEYYLKNYE